MEEPREREITHEQIINYMTTACRYAEITVTPKKVAILIRLYQEIMERKGDITLSEIDDIREVLDNELKDIEKVKRRRGNSSDKVQKQGDKAETWIEKHIQRINDNLPDVSEYKNGTH